MGAARGGVHCTIPNMQLWFHLCDRDAGRECANSRKYVRSQHSTSTPRSHPQHKPRTPRQEPPSTIHCNLTANRYLLTMHCSQHTYPYPRNLAIRAVIDHRWVNVAPVTLFQRPAFCVSMEACADVGSASSDSKTRESQPNYLYRRRPSNK